MATPQEIKQQIAQREADIKKAAGEVNLFNPSISQSYSQLLKATPLSQNIIKEQERFRALAKKSAFADIETAQTELTTVKGQVLPQIETYESDVAKQNQLAYDFETAQTWALKGLPPFSLNKQQKEFYTEISQGLKSLAEYQKQQQGLRELGLKPIYDSSGTLTGFEDTQNQVSYPLSALPNFRQMDLPKLEELNLIKVEKSFATPEFNQVPMTFAPPQLSKLGATTINLLGIAGKPAEYFQKLSELERKSYEDISRRVGFGKEVNLFGTEARSFEVPQKMTSGGGKELFYSYPETKFTLPTSKQIGKTAEVGTLVAGYGTPILGQVLLGSSAAKGFSNLLDIRKTPEERLAGGIEAGLSSAFLVGIPVAKTIYSKLPTKIGLTKGELKELETLSPDSQRYYELRLKSLRNLEQTGNTAGITAIQKDFPLSIKPTGPQRMEIAVLKNLQKRLDLTRGEGITTPTFGIETGLGSEKLTQVQINALADDYVKMGVFKTFKEAKRTIEESSVGVSGFKTYLPSGYKTMGGQLGDIEKFLGLPPITTRADITAPREFREVLMRGTVAGKKGQRSILSSYTLTKDNRLIGGKISSVKIPKKGRYAEIEIFGPGRSSDKRITTGGMEFIQEIYGPVRKTERLTAKITPKKTKFVNLGNVNLVGRTFDVETRLSKTKPQRLNPLEFAQALLKAPSSSKAIKLEFEKGATVLKTAGKEATMIKKPEKFLDIIKTDNVLIGRAGMMREFGSLTKRVSVSKMPFERFKIELPEIRIAKTMKGSDIVAGGYTKQELKQISEQIGLQTVGAIPRRTKVSIPRLSKTIPKQTERSSFESIYAGRGLYERTDTSGRTLGRDITSVKDIEVLRVSPSMRSAFFPIVKEREIVISRPDVALLPSERVRQRFREELIPAERIGISSRIKVIPRERVVPTIIPQPPRKPPHKEPPPGPPTGGGNFLFDDSGRRKLKRGYTKQLPGELTIEVRRKGKFIPLAFAGTPGIAFAKGKEITRRTLAASFRVRTPTGKLLPILPSEEFGTAKRGQFILVQKKTARLSSFGERREIQRAKRGFLL